MICWHGNTQVNAEFYPCDSMSQSSARFTVQDRYDNFELVDHF